jgi:hypothetical protein
MKQKKGTIDSVMQGFPPVKGMASNPGSYNVNPALGPAGVSGGLPLKFMEGAVKQPVLQETSNTQVLPTPTAKTYGA